MNVRKNVKNMTADEKTRFVNAVLALKAQPSVLHPGQQGRYDDYVEVHVNAMMAASGNPGDPDFVPGWGHDGPAFLPWHRELLLQLENDLQAAVNDPSITIPYWDWSDPASWPFTDDFLGGDGAGSNMQVQTGPFAFTAPAQWTLKVKDSMMPNEPDFLQRALGIDPTASNLPTTDQVNTTISSTPYDSSPWKYDSTGFRQDAQYGPHNMVHRYVGGTMLGMDSPNDPVFWLNHCNVDRLWSEWQRQHPVEAAYLPTTGATTGQNLDDNMIFNANPPPPWSGSSTPRSVIDHHALGYSYDSETPATSETFARSMAEDMLSRASRLVLIEKFFYEEGHGDSWPAIIS
jgi:tyrosinase